METIKAESKREKIKEIIKNANFENTQQFISFTRQLLGLSPTALSFIDSKYSFYTY